MKTFFAKTKPDFRNLKNNGFIKKGSDPSGGIGTLFKPLFLLQHYKYLYHLLNLCL